MQSVFLFLKVLMIFLISLFAIVLGLFVVIPSIKTWSNQIEKKNIVDKSFGLEVANEEVNLNAYQPFAERNLLVKVRPDPILKFSNEDAPSLDGATAAYPVYAAAAQALYSAEAAGQKVNVNNTPKAYERLINREVDIIFVAKPSKAQKQLANEKNVRLRLTPIGKEAFVFLVSQTNPVTNLTAQQIRDIYSGRATQWNHVGGNNETIMAFQRPENSGSQTVMLAKVMRDDKMREPLQEEKVRSMGGAVRRVATYRNAAQSIGYSFRYYATQMQNQAAIKLLSVDGIAPTVENIRSGTYPFTVDVFMVTAGEPTPAARKFMDWVLSPLGQKLIQDTGYVPLK